MDSSSYGDRLTSRDSRLPRLNPAREPVRQKNRAISQFIARVLLISFFDYHGSFNLKLDRALAVTTSSPGILCAGQLHAKDA